MAGSTSSRAARGAARVLQADWDPTFSAHSFGFRPGRSAHQAVARAQELIASGHGIVVDIESITTS
jgi:RNA-directed DNA polymerase